MRTARLAVLAIALMLALAPLSAVASSTATSAAKKKCKTGFVLKNVKQKRKGKNVLVRKCVRKKATTKKPTTPAVDPNAVLPGAYNGTTSQGLPFQATVSKSRGLSFRITLTIRVTCTDAAGAAQQLEVPYEGGGGLLNGIVKSQLSGRPTPGQRSTPVLRGTVRGGKFEATVLAETLRTCQLPQITLNAAL